MKRGTIGRPVVIWNQLIWDRWELLSGAGQSELIFNAAPITFCREMAECHSMTWCLLKERLSVRTRSNAQKRYDWRSEQDLILIRDLLSARTRSLAVRWKDSLLLDFDSASFELEALRHFSLSLWPERKFYQLFRKTHRSVKTSALNVTGLREKDLVESRTSSFHNTVNFCLRETQGIKECCSLKAVFLYIPW